ncbi:MAG: helix-turn-helix domain-containing protein [Bacteroidota bacterium]
MSELIPEIYFRKDYDSPLQLEVISFEDMQTLFSHPLGHDPFKPHQLKFNILIVITGGKPGIHSIDFKDHSYQDRCVMLISKDQIHSFVDLPYNNEGYLLMFSDELFIEIGSSYPFLINHFYNNQLYDPIHRLKKKDFGELLFVVRKIIHKMEDKRHSVRLEVVQSYFKILLLEIFSCREWRYGKIQKNSLTEDFIKFQLLLKENFIKEKKVKFYAQKLNMTPRKLNQITQTAVHLTAKNFITSFVILEAKKYLISPTLSAKEVAYKLGFDEPTNFTKFFKNHTHMLPTEFVKSH